MEKRAYICIDLKSFYASVECVERGLDPMTTNLVVADIERSEKTICLAISPSMKKLGIHNRCRLFEIPKNIEYITATPRMKKYIDYSANIYEIYLRYFSPDDIHVYSIDESFIDITPYLKLYNKKAKEIGSFLLRRIYKEIGIRGTCGIGTNLYLCKIALDILAKHSPDFIGMLTENRFIKLLWDHRPLTDFWRIGPGIARRLEEIGIYTMGDIAHCNEDMLYRIFGIDAELMIDHSWGRETVTISDIKKYKPKINSLSSGQVLMRDYSYDEGRLIIKEMTYLLCLDLVTKDLVTRSITLFVGYSNNLNIEPVTGTVDLGIPTSGDRVIVPAVVGLYNKIVNEYKKIKRVNITCNNVKKDVGGWQTILFDILKTQVYSKKNKKIQKAVNSIKDKYGKNAILNGMDLEEGAMTITRNKQIGGHKSGE